MCNYDKHDVLLEDVPDKLCIVCWLPSKHKEPVNNMKDIICFFSNCKCNALIHKGCLRTWLRVNSSCPICRKNACFMLVNCDEKYIKLTKLFLICFRHLHYFLKLASVFTTIYVSFYIFYICIFFDISLLYDNNINFDKNEQQDPL